MICYCCGQPIPPGKGTWAADRYGQILICKACAAKADGRKLRPIRTP